MWSFINITLHIVARTTFILSDIHLTFASRVQSCTRRFQSIQHTFIVVTIVSYRFNKKNHPFPALPAHLFCRAVCINNLLASSDRAESRGHRGMIEGRSASAVSGCHTTYGRYRVSAGSEVKLSRGCG
jgi:hypothetical protein